MGTDLQSPRHLGFASAAVPCEPIELVIRGTLPSWLDGTLVRNGPALFEAGTQRFRHWFDGQAMLHQFLIAGGRVQYRSRPLQTASHRAAVSGRISYGEFATDPCRAIFAKVHTLFGRRLTPNASVNVAVTDGRMVALGETPVAVEFDRRTMRTAGVVAYADRLRGQVSSAHPHRMPNGAMLNYLLKLGPRSCYQLYTQVGDVRIPLARVPSDRPSYVHSFAMTQRYAVLALFPFVVTPASFVLRQRPFIENYVWRPERGTRFVVIELASGAVRAELSGPPMFAFHHINAFEDGADLVVDLVAYPDAGIVDAFYLDRLRGGAPLPRAYPTRVRLSPATGGVDVRRCVDTSLELPRIAYVARHGRPYAYAYGIGADGAPGAIHQMDFYDQLVKVDFTSGSARTWSVDDCYPGEPVFVARPGGRSEDDGVLLTVVLDVRAGRSALIVLDAASLEPMARADVPRVIPFGFHGQFNGGTMPAQ